MLNVAFIEIGYQTMKHQSSQQMNGLRVNIHHLIKQGGDGKNLGL